MCFQLPYTTTEQSPPRKRIASPSPLPLLHHLHEIFEQVMRIMRVGAGFRMILHAEQRQVAMAQTFERRVVQVHVRQLDFGLRQRVGIYREVVVVRSDLDLARVQLLHRMIAAVVAELQLERLAAKREARELVAETDAE